METLALIAAVGVLTFIGFKFYQKRRSETKPVETPADTPSPESFKFPDPPQQSSSPTEFPSVAKQESKSEPFNGFPKSPEPVVEEKPTKPKTPRKPKVPKPTVSTAPAKKSRKSKV